MDYLVVGAGFSGSVVAREIAEQGKRVLLLEKRNHLGGNSIDRFNSSGLLVHSYGPHIFHTTNQKVYSYLSRFTDWHAYEHHVLASVDGTCMPLPFNLNSLDLVFGELFAKEVGEKLVATYGATTSILEMRKQSDPQIKQVAEYMYNHIFYHYTKKQWGLEPEQLDPSVTARVPMRLNYDNRYFEDRYQGVPKEGYHKLFSRLLDHPNITVSLQTNSLDLIKLFDGAVYVDNTKFSGGVIYTGALDELFKSAYGALPYRGVSFEFETHSTDLFQPCGTVNYTMNESFTRITEFKHLTGQSVPGRTTIAREFPYAYKGKSGETPSYPILNQHNKELYRKYYQESLKYANLYPLGRLAEYRYINMDQAVEQALNLSQKLSALGEVSQ